MFFGVRYPLIAAFTSIISVANPLAGMPVFLSLTEHNTESERIAIAQKASFYMLLILVIFLLAGNYIMSFFGISLSGTGIAGGLIILRARAAYVMLNPSDSERKISEEIEETAANSKSGTADVFPESFKLFFSRK